MTHTFPTHIENAERLTEALRAVVPSVEGISVPRLGTTVTIRAMGVFTPGQEAQVTAACLAYNDAAQTAAKLVRETAQRIARAQNPAVLTMPQRVARLELILNLD